MHNLSREQKIELVKLRKKRSVESLSIATVAITKPDTNGSVSSFLPQQNIVSAL